MTIDVPQWAIVIHGDPMPAPRPRIGYDGGHNPRAYRDYREWMAATIRSDLAAAEIDGMDSKAAYGVDLHFYRRNPKIVVDLDNMIKTALDAITMSRRFWRDDDQIVELHATKQFDPQAPRTELLIYYYKKNDDGGAKYGSQIPNYPGPGARGGGQGAQERVRAVRQGPTDDLR